MDLNYLLARHQISLMRAQDASGSEARVAHRRLASEYAQRIEALKTQLGADFHTAAVA
ncbi:hypothetical protein LK533_17265 [Sphingomonas sp. PL-96]|uniref:hypothetical protein n=1 Tax=Sphingomonas sp. PL-96 TaxID=2887201 RepID=UPI001E55BDEC|nr:hypothetical protein [Sphingomonas sp. PL-96]MCC2978402.1 hypothetical protein [Sphingomonas sp. PL-96]